MSMLRQFNSYLPFQVAVAGRKRNLMFAVMDRIFASTARDDVIGSPLGAISIDASHAAERWLSYAFFNILNFYAHSPLGSYMAQNGGGGSMFVDVGANLGMYSLVAKSNGYSACLVEPEPMFARFLARNERVFGNVYPVALSDQPGNMPLYYEASNSGAQSLVPAAGYVKGSDLVSVRTFSDLAAEGAFGDPGNIALIKVDVEGAEAQTVAGMSEFLGGGHRPAIWCEVRGMASGRAPGTYRDVANSLSRFGYSPLEYNASGARSPTPGDLEPRGVFDLLFER